MSGNAALIAMQFIEITYEGIYLFLHNIVDSLRGQGSLFAFVCANFRKSFFFPETAIAASFHVWQSHLGKVGGETPLFESRSGPDGPTTNGKLPFDSRLGLGEGISCLHVDRSRIRLIGVLF